MQQFAIPIFFIIIIVASLTAYSISSLDITGLFVKTTSENISQPIETQTTQNLTEQKKIIQQTVTPICPDCDDNNPCTKDECSAETNYTCKYTKLRGETEGCKDRIEGTCSKYTCISGKCIIIDTLDCCGNLICENGENYSNCPKDCPQTTSQQIENQTTQSQENQTQPVNAANHVVISEIQITDNEFVELYNPTSTVVDMNGWYFSYYSSARDWNDPYRNKPFPEGATIVAYGFYLIGLSGISNADWQPYTSNQLSNTGGSVAIFPFDPKIKTSNEAMSGRIDVIGWGSPTYVFEGSPQIVPESGTSLERKPSLNNPTGGNWQDTDNNMNDFISRDSPEPQNSFSTKEIPS